MLPLTKNIPKVLIDINGKPFLYYVLETLKKAGFDDIGIIVSYKKEQFPEFLKKYGFKAVLIDQKQPLGTGHAVMQARDFTKDEDFIVLGGDNLWSVDDFQAIAKKNNLNYVAGIEVSDPEKYGVLVTENDTLIGIKEKPQKHIGNLINTALYKFTKEIYKALDQIKKSPRGEYEITDAINILAKKEKVKIIKVKDFWIDLGSIEDIEKVEEKISKFF